MSPIYAYLPCPPSDAKTGETWHSRESGLVVHILEDNETHLFWDDPVLGRCNMGRVEFAQRFAR